MKHLFTAVLAIALLMASSIQAEGPAMQLVQGIQRVLPIVTTSPITQVDGTVVSNMQRKGYSYYYSGGGVYGGYNDSFIGEMVVGNDGNLYFKNVCASAAMNTYFMLEPVNDTLYVGHTAQMVYVDNSGDTPYAYYATRLVFTQLASGFTWQVEEVDGVAQTDIYFTYKDGVLRQRDRTIVDLGDYQYPYELLALTNVNGGWIGFGDALIEFIPADETPTTLPEGAQLQDVCLDYHMLSSKKGVNATDAKVLKAAEVGNDYHLQCPLEEGDMWIRGEIDRTDGTVTFHQQYIGLNTERGLHQWFMPTTYRDWFDLIDEEDNYGYWTREYDKADALVMRYENGVLTSDTALHQVFTISRSSDIPEGTGYYANVKVQPYEVRHAAPINPIITAFEENNGLWGEFAFYVSPVDATGMILSNDNLYYRVYRNHQTTPYVFTTTNYMDIPADMTDVPVSYSDGIDIETNVIHHWMAFYEEDWANAGVQAVYKHDGQEYTSDIVWSDGNVDSRIEDITPGEGAKKIFRDGQLLIIRNGRIFTLTGNQIHE